MQVLKLGGSLDPLFRMSLQSGQTGGSAFGAASVCVAALGVSGGAFTGADVAVWVCCGFSCLFSSVLSAAGCLGSFTGTALGEAGGVVLGDTLDTVDILRGVGGVVLGSSCTAEVNKVDAELRKDDPKPNILPVTEPVAGAAAGCVLAPPNPKKPPDSCLGG